MTTSPLITHLSDCAPPDVRLVRGGGTGYLGCSYHKCLTCEQTDLPKVSLAPAQPDPFNRPCGADPADEFKHPRTINDESY